MKATVRTYGRTELAQIYFPNILPGSAWHKFHDLITDDPRLEHLLPGAHRYFLPVEVELIFDCLGTPSL